MRLEATIPDSRGAVIEEVSKELGLTKSQLVDEAVALFLGALAQVRKGRRVAIVNKRDEVVSEILTPSLVHLDWHHEKLTLSAEAGQALLQELEK